MAEVPLEVRVTVDSAAVRKALRGIQKEIVGTEKKAQKEIEKTNRARTRGLMKQKSQIKQLGDEFKRLGGSVERELQKSMFSGVKNGFKRSRDFLRRNKGALAIGALTGAAAGARSGYRRASGFLGLPTQQGAFKQAEEYRVKFRQFANAAGMSASDRDAAMKRFRTKSAATGATEGDILSGGARVQAAMGPKGLQAYEDNLDNLININQSLGAPIDDLAGVLVELNRQFGLTADEFPEALGFMVEAANEGSIEVTDFAGNMRGAMGIWASSFGKGMAQWKELVSSAEATGTTYGAAETGTAIERGAENLGLARQDPKLRRTARRMGLDLMLPPSQLGEQMRARGTTDMQLKELFPDVRSRRFLRSLRDQGSQQYLGLNGEEGLTRAGSQAQDFRSSPEGKLTLARAEILRNVNEQFKSLAEASMDLAGQFEVMASQNVLVAQGLGTLSDALIAAGVVIGAKKVLQGGGKEIAKEVAKQTGTVAAGGTAGTAAAGGMLAPILALAAGGVIAGGASFGGNTILDRTIGGGKEGAEARRQKHLDWLGEGSRDLKDSARDLRRAAGNLANASSNTGRQEGGP